MPPKSKNPEVRRKTLIRSLIFYCTEANKLNENSSKTEALNRLVTMEKSYKEFIEINKQIETEDIDNEPYIDENIKIENDYIITLSHLQELTKSEESIFDSTNNELNHSHHADYALPPINIPPFSGKYEDWVTFEDLFMSLVHNTRQSDAQKMQRLKSLLKGNAYQAIKHLAVTNENYASALIILKERFNNTRAIVNSHLKRLFSLSKLNSPRANNIRLISDTIKECLQALDAIRIPTGSWDPLIVFLIETKMDSSTQREWEYHLKGTTKIPTVEELQIFLEIHCRVIEACEQPHANDNVKTHTTENSNEASANKHISPMRSTCILCNESHKLIHCEEFLNKTISERIKFVNQKSLCDNCFGNSHSRDTCMSKFTCRTCKQKHHSLLHIRTANTNNLQIIDEEDDESDTTDGGTNATGKNEEDNQIISCHINKYNSVLLATAKALVSADVESTPIQIRMLIDPCSQCSFVSEKISQYLHLERTQTNVSITSVNNSVSKPVRHEVNINVMSMQNDFKCKISALVIKSVTALKLESNLENCNWAHLSNLNLADPEYFKRGNIDMLLGGDEYGEIILHGLRKGKKDEPIAQNTVFGWIITGKTNQSTGINKRNERVTLTTIADVNSELKKFWELEEVGHFNNVYTQQEQMAEEHYIINTSRNNDGRYIVKLPFKNSEKQSFYGTRKKALRRLIQLESSFKKKPQLKEEYNKCMAEYIELGHMELSPEQGVVDGDCYFMPHHAVFKETSSKKQLRVVFDASSKDENNLSLNDTLLVGPTIQPKLFNTILQWRNYKYVFSTDIQKMYRQILVHADDAKFQQIIWRFSETEPFKNYTLKTLTFGTANAAFQAIRTLKQLAIDESEKYSLIKNELIDSTYVDDIYCGGFSIDEAKQKRNELIKLLAEGGFALSKWASNDKRILDDFPAEIQSSPCSIKLDEFDDVIRTLGIEWKPRSDDFSFSVNFEMNDETITKRQFLSQIAKIYDPLGFLGPVTILFKILLQEIWKRKIEWDEKLPDDLYRKWKDIRDQCNLIKNIRIPRWLNFSNTFNGISLIGFCDASENAYAAVVYLRAELVHEPCKITIVAAKTKVAPLKDNTIPRLELCAAILLTELIEQIKISIPIKKKNIHVFSDSQIVLAWIKGEASRWKIFVSNRVQQIQQILPSKHWSYVATNDNPADCASRGIKPSELKMHKLWWNGPKWLGEPHEKWPNANKEFETKLEIRPKVITTMNITANESNDLLFSFKTLEKLIKVTAYCLRIFKVAKEKKNRNSFPVSDLILTVEERQNAIRFWIKNTQNDFQEELKLLTNNKMPKCKAKGKNRLINLNPFVDNNDIIRVGGRLKNANLSYPQKYPPIIPSNSHLAKLIIDNSHEYTLHGGTKLTLAHLRRRYWILNGRNAVRYRIKSCLECTIANPETMAQLMADLPKPRVNQSDCFVHCGLDFAGPIEIRASKLRKAPIIKCYICLFVCLSTKAIHLECVSDLTTASFLAAIRRLISTRGMMTDIYCDNGTNFVGAKNELPRLLEDSYDKQTIIIKNELLKDEITFHFSPPRSPTFGGIWERNVRSVKHHLKRIVGSSKLTFEEMDTLLKQIAGSLNSRPLCPVRDDPDDLEMLTPGHFLTHRTINTPPEPSLVDVNSNHLTRWQFVQKLYHQFWFIWNNEYLSELQTRSKWLHKYENAEIGQLVILREPNIPPCKWLKGRIMKTFKGDDDLIRVVEIRTKNGIVKRGINQICKLPITNLSSN